VARGGLNVVPGAADEGGRALVWTGEKEDNFVFTVPTILKLLETHFFTRNKVVGPTIISPLLRTGRGGLQGTT
jgi:hypothetical protein